MSLLLKSRAFAQGGQIPRKYTCDGMNVSPPLEWSGVSAGTKSLLLVCYDPDAPGITFQHWVAYNIPPDLQRLEERPAATRDERFMQAVNSFGKSGYGGPCPPRGHGPHNYHFRLSALKHDIEGTSAKTTCAEIIERAKHLEIGASELVGVYER